MTPERPKNVSQINCEGKNAYGKQGKQLQKEGIRMKECTKCKKSKALSEFHKNPNTKDKKNSRCKECASVTSAAQYAQGYQSEHYFGLTNQQRHELYKRTGYVCQMCGQEERYANHKLCIDHDRNCCDSRKSCGDCVRGILCSHCNMMLGRHERKNGIKRPDILENIHNYLEKQDKEMSMDEVMDSSLPTDLLMRL